jgi:hypothetical protein
MPIWQMMTLLIFLAVDLTRAGPHATNCGPSAETRLWNHAKKHHESRAAGAIAQQPLFLFEEEKHRPENARGFAQKFLVAIALVAHKKRMPLLGPEGAEPVDAPPSVRSCIQGNPGTGKSFVIHTTCNIARNLLRVMGRDRSAAPTGCAACLSCLLWCRVCWRVEISCRF